MVGVVALALHTSECATLARATADWQAMAAQPPPVSYQAGAQPKLHTSSELLSALGWHMLKRLSVADLGNLAATCTALRTWVAAAHPAIWRSAARTYLPVGYPASLQGCGVQEVRLEMDDAWTTQLL